MLFLTILSRIEIKIILVLTRLFQNISNGLFDKNKILIPYPELSTLLETFNDKNDRPPDVLYFGDSVLLRVSRDDINKNTLDQFVADEIGDRCTVLSVAHTAYHMLVYKGFIRILKQTISKPKIVILPINLRSFSPQWDFHPAWQFRDEIKVLNRYDVMSSIDIRPYDELRVKPALLKLYDAIWINYPVVGFKLVGYFRRLIKFVPESDAQRKFRLKNIFIFHYLHLLVSNHPKLVALSECIELLHDMDIKTVVYITPINWQAGEKYVGAEFVEKIKSNVKCVLDIVSASLNKDTLSFFDFSMLLDSDCFFSEDNATEHLNQKGRGILARRIKEMVFSFE